MGSYTHVLAAIDLDPNGERVLQRARDLAQTFGARLSIVHVVEYVALDSGEGLIATPVDLTAQLVQKARGQLDSICQRQGIAPASSRVLSGPVPMQILEAARELNADLIAVGHQARRGWLAALFSHTEQNVVSRAPCDVLALRLPDETG